MRLQREVRGEQARDSSGQDSYGAASLGEADLPQAPPFVGKRWSLSPFRGPAPPLADSFCHPTHASTNRSMSLLALVLNLHQSTLYLALSRFKRGVEAHHDDSIAKLPRREHASNDERHETTSSSRPARVCKHLPYPASHRKSPLFKHQGLHILLGLIYTCHQ